jgi:hypothetical protein
MGDVDLQFEFTDHDRNAGIIHPTTIGSKHLNQVMGRKLGTDRLQSRELVCAVANSQPISAAEVALTDPV